VSPFARPVPPSPDTSAALLAAFAEREITFVPERKVASLDGSRSDGSGGVAVLDDGAELPYDLFLGVPKHRAPPVVEAAGMLENGWVKVNPRTLETPFPGVYALGDIAGTGTPKAGVFAEGTARAAAAGIIAAIEKRTSTELYSGAGTCYVEFGEGRVGRVDVDFFSGPKPTGTFVEPSLAIGAEKEAFGSTRRERWFGSSR
jgi:sulfide:quinone oxidoreductase